ncbi:hypothetical protein CI109_105854 [Kwoniella shandongensis]|uniref:Large ribosomal subunit protein mL59 domain-containing protein n=1 Tax=Kwoniella shandongensis TaxID=1734106 RepID=A0A5M6BSX6_9TREE|nr:uncharacterized protein CI109_005711 [Kwoniella shandongensis]KAA5525964.1 hypothetical protein CI109_005711 [Kwoniella shandongensis]
MNSITRRLFSTSSRVCSESLPFDPSTPVPAQLLPRVLYRQVERRLSNVPRSGKQPEVVSLSNPFLLHRGVQRADSESSDEPRYHWRQPTISHRRQKQLLQYYSGVDLPASKLNPQGVAREVQWTDGTIVRWQGEVRVKEDAKKGVYAGRKRMFKGHRDERDKPQKEADRQTRLDGMEKRIAEWKKSKADEKARNRPSLPF